MRRRKSTRVGSFRQRYPKASTALIILSVVSVFVLFILFIRSNGNFSSSFDPLYGYDGPIFNVLVTGGAGFIGSHVVEFFENSEYCSKIVVVDNLHTGKRENLEGFNKVVFVEGSIEDFQLFEQTLEKYKIGYVFHLAALISVPESMEIPDEYFRINTQGTSNIIRYSEKSPTVKRVLFASSAALYGTDPSVPKFENALPECESYYAVNKLDGEFISKIVTRSSTRDFLAISLRFFNVFGERQDPNSAYAAVIPNFITKACLEKEKMSIFGDGEQTRDFIYVKDVVNALVFMAFNKKRGDDIKKENLVYNVGYESSTTINSLADLIHDICPIDEKKKKSSNRDEYILYKDARIGDVRHSRASSKKLREEGWKPKYDFDESLKKTVNWFLENI